MEVSTSSDVMLPQEPEPPSPMSSKMRLKDVKMRFRSGFRGKDEKQIHDEHVTKVSSEFSPKTRSASRHLREQDGARTTARTRLRDKFSR